MSKKLTKKLYTIICAIAVLAMAGPFSFGSASLVWASGYTTKTVETISNIEVSPSSTVLSATTSYLFSFRLNAAMTVTDIQQGGFNVSTYFNGPSDDSHSIDFRNATLSYVEDDGVAMLGIIETQPDNPTSFSVSFIGPLNIASGSTITILINNVVNPVLAGTYGTDMRVEVWGPNGGSVGQGRNDQAMLLGIDKFIEGHVTYKTGGAVTTCQVNANKQGAQEWANTPCDNNGFYRLGLTSGGTWQVHLDAKWVENQRVTTDWIWQGQDPVTEVSATGTYTQNFSVEKADATVKGKLLMSDGTVPANPERYHVDLRTQEGQGSGAPLGNDGAFTIPIKSGTYNLSIWSENPKYYVSPTKVTVGTGEIKNMGTLTIKEKTAYIKGTVLDNSGDPVANLRMNMWSPTGWGEARTGTNGSFTLWGYKGEWEVSVDQMEASQRGLIMKGQSQKVTLDSDTDTATGVNFILLKSNARVILNVVDSDGQAIQNINGYAYCRKADVAPGPNSDFGMGLGGQNQQVNIALLGGYTYVCGVNLPSELGYSLDKEIEVTVAVGQTKTAKVTLVENDAEIVGYLRDAVSGAVITNVDAEVFANGEMMGSGYWARVNADGSYRLSLRHGTYFIGHNIRESGYMQGNPDNTPITVAAGARVVKTIKVHKANAYIEASVLDPAGNLVKWAWVWCNNMKQKEEEVKGPFEGGDVLNAGGDTRENGKALIGVVAGNYSCGAGMPPEMASYMPPENVDVLADANTTTKITLKFKESEGTIAGTVTREDGTASKMGFCHAWNPEGGFSGGQVYNGSYSIPLTRGTWYVGCDAMDGTSFYRSDETQIALNTVGQTIDKDFLLIKSQWDIPEGISKTFDVTQMTVINLPDGSIISIPANAVANEGTYTLTASPNVNIYHTPEAKPALGFAWSLELTDSNGQSVTSNFNSNVSITIKYNEEELAAEGIDESKIIGRYWDESSSTWKLPENVIQNIDENTVTIMLNHFTDFAITTGSQQLGARTAKEIVAAPKAGGGPQVTVWDSNGTRTTSFMAYATTFRGGVRAISADLDGNGTKEIVTVPYSDGGPHIRVFDSSGKPLAGLFPYLSSFRGALSLAVGDVDGDGAKEIIVAPASGGGPHVRIYKYANGSLTHYTSFFAYAKGLRTGINVNAGDVNGDGIDEIVTSTRQGATPHVRTFDGTGNVLGQFFAFPMAFRGGVNVTVADTTGDGTDEIIVTPSAAGGPQVRVLSYQGKLVSQFFAYNSSYRIGLVAKAGDVDGDSAIEIVTAPLQGGPHIRVFSNSGALEYQFMAYNEAFRGGVSLEVADLDANGTAEIITAPLSAGGPHVRTFDASGNPGLNFMCLHPGFRGGVNMTVSR